MLTEKPSDAAAPSTPCAETGRPRRAGSATSRATLMREAKVSIMTHAFMYDRGDVRGIRVWNEDQQRLYGLKMREHRRAHPPVVPDPADGRHPVGRRADRADRRDRPAQRLPSDAYIRPSFYKSTRAIGVRFHELADELYIVASCSGTTSTPRTACA